MPLTSEQDIEIWIASRKRTPAAHLSSAVMEAIHSEMQPPPKFSPKSKPPSRMVAAGCLLAGVGKLGLVIHLAF